MKSLFIITLVILSGCSFGKAVQLEPGEKGAVCYGATGQAANPFVKGDTYGRGIEIATGNEVEVLTPEQIVAIANALGCGR